MRSRHGWFTGSMLAMALVGAGPALAQGHAGIFGGIYEPDDDLDSTEIFGLRGGYRFNPHFGFEASLGRVDLADAIQEDPGPGVPPLFDFDLQIDLYALDLSLQWFPTGRGFVVFGGPGWSRIDFEVEIGIFGESFSSSDTEDILTAHAGIGYEWELGERFFARPEVRVRRYFGDEGPDGSEETSVSYKATDYEATVTFGIRFGGH